MQGRGCVFETYLTREYLKHGFFWHIINRLDWGKFWTADSNQLHFDDFIDVFNLWCGSGFMFDGRDHAESTVNDCMTLFWLYLWSWSAYTRFMVLTWNVYLTFVNLSMHRFVKRIGRRNRWNTHRIRRFYEGLLRFVFTSQDLEYGKPF